MTVNTKSGKITASKDVLNLISLIASNARDYQREQGRMSLSEQYDELGHEIYQALDSFGFYDDVR